MGQTKERGIVFLFAAAFLLAAVVFGIAHAMVSEDRLLVSINELRRKEGLPPLHLSVLLTRGAQAKLADMEARGYFGHDLPDGEPWTSFVDRTGYRWIRLGENLARGFGEEVNLVRAWLASDSHRAILLRAEYEEVGIATDGRVVVAYFGKPRLPLLPIAEAQSGVVPTESNILMHIFSYLLYIL